jgi:peroxiredoxin Q/BCP
LRLDYGKFQECEAEIIALGPDGPNAFRRFWQQEDMPFIGLADIRSATADRYYQEVNLLKLGRMPAVFVIDKHGYIRYAHYGDSMADIPSNDEVLKVLDGIRVGEKPEVSREHE